MPTIEDVLSNLEKQRRSWEEFKVVQDTRLGIAEQEIRAMFIKTRQPGHISVREHRKHCTGNAS